jgi:hypothetical protein
VIRIEENQRNYEYNNIINNNNLGDRGKGECASSNNNTTNVIRLERSTDSTTSTKI